MTTKTKINPIYKFTIYSRLQNLSKKNYQLALINLPELLNVSSRQFKNYMYAKIDSRVNLTSEKLIILAKYLKCSMEDLFTDLESITQKVENSKKTNFKFLG